MTGLKHQPVIILYNNKICVSKPKNNEIKEICELNGIDLFLFDGIEIQMVEFALIDFMLITNISMIN